ncbi:hypothetical protein HMPREF2808_08620 [Corynebacterium sp. HMSC078A10]|nr:hypothetical protein HMPREF2808_08620 [Corynebacterium sp. HMSC078A10]
MVGAMSLEAVGELDAELLVDVECESSAVAVRGKRTVAAERATAARKTIAVSNGFGMKRDFVCM